MWLRIASALVLLLLPASAIAERAPEPAEPSIPDPCITAPNLPFCR